MKQSGALKLAPSGDREIVMTRVFDAPRRLVFDAWTRPELLRRWFGGPRGWTLDVCEINLKPGGAYRFLSRHADGREMAWGGEYREVIAPERLVVTEQFDQPWYPGEAVLTTMLAERVGKTTFTTVARYESQAARDTVLKTGMERGLAEMYERLDELLAAVPA